MTSLAQMVFLLDCDNTLLDNDAVQDDLRGQLTATLGAEGSTRYWSLYEQLRGELGYADYLGALERYRDRAVSDPRLFTLASFLLEYPFATRLYPGAIEVIRHLQALGPTVILSDGDVVFQPRKIQRSGLWDAVEGRVLIYVHKEQVLAAIAQRYPALHYVMVDDKPRILAAMKQSWGSRVTTVFVRQGHYAAEHPSSAAPRGVDLTLERIGDLVRYEMTALQKAARAGPMPQGATDEGNATTP